MKPETSMKIYQSKTIITSKSHVCTLLCLYLGLGQKTKTKSWTIMEVCACVCRMVIMTHVIQEQYRYLLSCYSKFLKSFNICSNIYYPLFFLFLFLIFIKSSFLKIQLQKFSLTNRASNTKPLTFSPVMLMHENSFS